MVVLLNLNNCEINNTSVSIKQLKSITHTEKKLLNTIQIYYSKTFYNLQHKNQSFLPVKPDL